jgi:cytochrome c biogenesis protein CcmG, thiol:disulfide interchange protein DsbE
MAKFQPLYVLPLAISLALGFAAWKTMNNNRIAEEAGLDANALPSAFEGRIAPTVVVAPLADLPVFTDANLRDGKVKLVNFWASWCAPCRAEHPNLSQLKAEGVTIYGVNYKDKPDAALGFLNDLGNPYAAIGADAGGRMGIDWGIYGVPETFIIDGEGKVITRFPGPITERVMEDVIRAGIKKAAAE